MIQIECFESNNIWKLQEQVNSFIKNLTGFSRIVDIKYNHISSHLPRHSEDDWNLLYTAMVIYDKTSSEEHDNIYNGV